MVRYILFLLFITFGNSSQAQVWGCTDPLATNYDNSATDNDGTCSYSIAFRSPVTSITLDSVIKETSGLILWNDHLYTQNDDGDTHLYELDTLTASITNSYSLPGVGNGDWEEISQDSTYIYIGDFGNNTSGNRTDLHVLRVEKSTLANVNPVIDTIYFSYADQTDFSATTVNHTDFDCESMIVTEDSIFIFTKQWVSFQTKLYGFPNTPGTYVANAIDSCTVNGLITGATYLPEKRMIVLSAYTTSISPFFFLLYDFPDHQFFRGNKRKIGTTLTFEQAEGVATSDGLKFYLSNERFDHSPIYNDEALHIFDLSPFLSGYLNSLILKGEEITSTQCSIVFPNPFLNRFTIENQTGLNSLPYTIVNPGGSIISSGIIKNGRVEVNAEEWPVGTYFLKLENQKAIPIIKK
jgi:hypothetical protein